MPNTSRSGRRNTSNPPAPLAANTSLLRRGLLLSLGGASAAVAVAHTLSGGGVRPAIATDAATTTRGKGYTATEHVRKYYRTTKT